MKILTIKAEGFNENKFVISEEDIVSKDFIMAAIKERFTDDEGQFRIRNLEIKVEKAINYASNMVTMGKVTSAIEGSIKW